MNIPGLTQVTPPCPHCEGVGPVWVRYGGNCPTCNGTGLAPSRLEWQCPTCNGTNVVTGLAIPYTEPNLTEFFACSDPNHGWHGRRIYLGPLKVRDDGFEVTFIPDGPEWTPPEGEGIYK